MHIQSKTLQLPIWQRVSTRTLFFVLATILICLFITYAYLVNKTIMNVVAREHSEKSISQLSATIGDLESKYLSLNDSITLELAYQKGFTDANPSFIAQNGSIAYNNVQ